jgi:hypothetical protein
MPKGARTSQAEGAQARMSACMPNGGRTHARGSVRKPNGGRAFQTDGAHVVLHANFGVSKGSAHVPKVARVGRMGGVQAQVGARIPI